VRTPTHLIASLLLALLAACAEQREAIPAGGGSECDRCHGSGPSGGPPPSLSGATEATDPKVGAHRAHLEDGAARAALGCGECHVVPATSSDPGHIDGQAAVRFGALAASGGAAPAYDRASGTCASTWCHAGAPGGAAPAPRWAVAASAGEGCAGCHGAPPGRPHPPAAWTACGRCHPGAGTPAAPATGTSHLDGVVNASRVHPAGWVSPAAHGAAALAGDSTCRECHGPDLLSPSSLLSCAACHGSDGGVRCDTCHGAPPASGAHAAHYADARGAERAAYGSVAILADLEPQGGPRYVFGCGHCHPLDPARHLDGRLDVDLAPQGAPAGSLKARNGAAAAYTRPAGQPAGSCASVYCHSSGQAAPAFVATPRWDAPAGALGCDGCHGNPPRYASGGPGSASANSHLYATEGGTFASGHFGGFPSFGHGGARHGGGDAGGAAAMVSCQTCHHATVDPANTGPSGFYYLDTSVDLDLGPGVTSTACGSCHGAGAGAPPAGRGRVLPLRHVNGARDVTFDPRTSVPAETPGLPAAPGRPAFPYWTTPASLTPVPGVDMSQGGGTLSVHLAAASYAPATKTCSNVACHLSSPPPTWGGTRDLSAACLGCHDF
jgi:predicted CxxxxCH...CXXCH cytochrome family protein